MHSANELLVIGGLSRSAPSRLEGWCWSPARPSERLVAEITINGKVASAIVAASLSVELRDRGIGDGYHAFSVSLPAPPQGSGVVVIEARERTTQILFGRVLVRKASVTSVFQPRLEPLDTAILELQAAVARSERSSSEIGIFARMSELGHLLNRRARRLDIPSNDDAVGLEIALQRISAMRLYRLPYFRSPELSVVVEVGRTFTETYSTIQALGALLERARAELVVIDDGASPAHALLRQKIENLGYIRQKKAGGRSGARNQAAEITRGSRVLFGSSLRRVGSLIVDGAPEWPGELVLGPTAFALACDVNAKSIFSEVRSARGGEGLVVCVDRELFEACGALDEECGFGHHLEVIDLALKADALGATVAAEYSLGAPFEPIATPRASDLARFLERWGMLAPDAVAC
jgi:hypothetical protein